MIKHIVKPGYILAALLVSACATTVTHQQPPVTDASTMPPGTSAPSEEQISSGDLVVPVEEQQDTAAARPPLVNPAVTSLINQSRAQYNARNYPAAIATAERGLRIDRRTPELYLLLAQSYLQQSNAPQAKQFVQQGLRFAQPGSPVAESLRRVEEILAGGDF